MNRLNAALLIVLLGCLALNLVLRPDPTRRSRSPLSNMAESVPADAFDSSAVFADGLTLRQPPAGTVPYGRPPLRYAATPEDAQRAGEELANPLQPTEANLARGATVFATYCTPCHGADGTGMGKVAQRGFPPPPSLLAANARRIRDGQMLHIITYGQLSMPAHAAQIPLADRWKAVLHVRSLQAKTPEGATP